MKKVYRIYVGLTIPLKNLSSIPVGYGNGANQKCANKIIGTCKDIMSRHVESFTIFNGNGQWQLITEPSICIEYIGTTSFPLQIVCNEIKESCFQSSVIATVSEANFYEF